MVFRRTRRRIHRGVSNPELLRRLQVSSAIHERNLIEAERRGLLGGEIEGLTAQVAALRRPVVEKVTRLSERVDRIVAPVQSLFTSEIQVGPILRRLGLGFITGSATFTALELRDAQIRVFFHTEGGFTAEMRLSPGDAPFYLGIIPEQADLLRQEDPPTELLARLFTRQETADH